MLTQTHFIPLSQNLKKKLVVRLLLIRRLTLEVNPLYLRHPMRSRCFMGTDLDVLAVGNYILLKHEQDESKKENYEEYELD